MGNFPFHSLSTPWPVLLSDIFPESRFMSSALRSVYSSFFSLQGSLKLTLLAELLMLPLPVFVPLCVWGCGLC